MRSGRNFKLTVCHEISDISCPQSRSPFYYVTHGIPAFPAVYVDTSADQFHQKLRTRDIHMSRSPNKGFKLQDPLIYVDL